MDISKQLEKARDAAERRNYAYAIELYRMALKLKQDDTSARKELRAVEVRQHKEKGVSFVSKGRIALNVTKAQGLLRAKKYESAMEAGEDALQIDPNHPGALMVVGRAALYHGFMNAAVVVFEHLRDCGSGNDKVAVEGIRELARAYEGSANTKEDITEQIAELEKALECWRQVSARLKGQDKEAEPRARDVAARITESKMKRDTEGAQGGSIARSVARDKDKVQRMARDEGSIRTTRELEQAIEDIKSDIEKTPEDARLYVKMGDFLKRGKRVHEAKLAYEKALELDPTNPERKFKLDDLEILRQSLEYNGIVEKYKAGDASLKEELGKRKGDIMQFKLNSFLEREQKYPTNFQIKFELGKIFYQLAKQTNSNDQYQEAIQRFQQTKRDPKLKVESALMLGEGFTAVEQYDLGLRTFEEAISSMQLKDDRWKSLVYAKGIALEKSGKQREALESFLSIYEIDVAYKDTAACVKRVQAALKEGAA